VSTDNRSHARKVERWRGFYSGIPSYVDLYPGQICGSRGWNAAIERPRRDAEALCDLRHADIWIGEHRLGGLDVLVREFWRTPSGAARTPSRGEAGLGALSDQAALEFRQRAKQYRPIRELGLLAID
jgi:hypothetical protein